MDAHLTDISRVIQLAVAPVFLLTGIGTLLNAMNTRLGRIVDRRRVLQERSREAQGGDLLECQGELEQLARRSDLIYYAMFCAVLSALLVCLVVASAFLGAMFAVDWARVVASLFVLAMAAMICGLGFFLREVFLAVRGGTHFRP